MVCWKRRTLRSPFLGIVDITLHFLGMSNEMILILEEIRITVMVKIMLRRLGLLFIPMISSTSPTLSQLGLEQTLLDLGKQLKGRAPQRLFEQTQLKAVQTQNTTRWLRMS